MFYHIVCAVVCIVAAVGSNGAMILGVDDVDNNMIDPSELQSPSFAQPWTLSKNDLLPSTSLATWKIRGDGAGGAGATSSGYVDLSGVDGDDADLGGSLVTSCNVVDGVANATTTAVDDDDDGAGATSGGYVDLSCVDGGDADLGGSLVTSCNVVDVVDFCHL